MTQQLPPFKVHNFTLRGEVVPLLKASLAGVNGHRPSRPMGGWLMTYGKITDDGTVVPTVDRDNQVMEAARELGHIDWNPYVQQGAWNDTHDENILVGVPSSLEFHDGHTPLSKAHRKVGFWTSGHLFDRNDPKSWELYTEHKPSEKDLQRADHFWTLAQMLKGLPRPLGFSAHGSMALSPCRSRIIWCQVRQAAVCELPKNPDATAEMLKGSPLELLRKGMARRKECGACSCPPWACNNMLAKATSESLDVPSAPVGSHPTDPHMAETFKTSGDDKLDMLVNSVMRQYFVDQPTALRWVRKYLMKKQAN